MSGTRINAVCPVVGCSRRLRDCKGRSRLPPPDFSLPVDQSLDAAVHSKVCVRCYQRHCRAHAKRSATIDVLLAAADIISTTPPPAPSSPPSLLLPPSFHSPAPLRPPQPPPSSPAPRPLADITNTPLKQRRHDTPLKRKRELVIAAAALSTPEQRKQLCVREGVSGRELRRYAVAVKENEQRLMPKQLLRETLSAAASEPPRKKRRSMTAKRLSGGGRKPAPVVLWQRVLSYLPASQTVTLSSLMQRHRRYYSGVDYRFPAAAGSRDREQEKRKSEEEGMEEEREEQEWGIVSVDSLYDVTSLPAGVEAGTLRLHPRALLLMR